jgi:hypothetical protein
MDGNLDLNKNSEIEEALREFDAKYKTEEMEKIPEISKNSEIPKMVQLIMKWSGGAIKEQRQAEYVLLGFVAVAIGISIYLMFGGLTTTPTLIDIQNIDQSQFTQFNE